ncbi:MAG TPA: hypothetical protein VM737_05490 [Gemmatimonadota bacterium]|nr:hypothetical protein [Gemmatimonadota bacterium]
MIVLRWTALPLAILFFAAAPGCGGDEPEERTTIIREEADDDDPDIQLNADDAGLEMDIRVDEEGDVSGEIHVEED